MDELLAKHQNIALQLSGGKDSVACLYLLRNYLDRMTVYHVNTQDQPPETKVIIDECRKLIPHFVEIKSDSRAWAEQNGYPSDVVPTSSSNLGRLLGFGKMPLADRFSCCSTNMMLPMYHRMKADGITLIIRGQKLCDMPTVPLKSGEAIDGFEFYYPIENWSDADVFKYLHEQNAPTHPAYTKINDAIDCMHCTAWWDKNHLGWLNEAHPEVASWVKNKHIEIKHAVINQMNNLE